MMGPLYIDLSGGKTPNRTDEKHLFYYCYQMQMRVLSIYIYLPHQAAKPDDRCYHP
jgi:hypothetical protein